MSLELIIHQTTLVAIVLVAAYTDVRWGKVYNWLTFPALAVGLLLAAVLDPFGIGIGGAGLGLLAGFLPLFLAYAAGGLGGGDVKLMAVVGTFLGPQLTLYALLYTFIAGAFLCLMQIVRHEGLRGMFTRLVNLRAVENGEGRVPLRFPFAVAVLIGVVWILAEVNLGSSLLDMALGRAA